MNRILWLIYFIVILSAPVQAFAAHPLSTDDSGTMGVMKFQLETTAEFGWDRESSDGVTTKGDYQVMNVSVTAGLTESLDLSLCVPYIWQHVEDNNGLMIENSGLNDFSLALKWRFLEIGPASLAIKPSITFPTGNRDRNLGAGRVSYGAVLISTVEFKPVAMHANIGYTNQQYTDSDKDGSREHLWNLSLAGSVEVMKGLQLVAEAAMSSSADKASGTWLTCLTGGVIYSVFENLDLSAGVKGSVTKPEVDLALLSGLTLKFP